MVKYKFKVGDKVKISEDSLWLADPEDKANPKDVEGVVTKVGSNDYILVKWPEAEYPNSYSTSDLVFSKSSHKHAELAKKWFDDPSIPIEYFDSGYCQWLGVDNPTWDKGFEYRIKPEPEPDLVEFLYTEISYGNHVICVLDHQECSNIKITFDGETRKLKSVEMI